MSRTPTGPESAFRLLPSVDEALREPRIAACAARVPRGLVLGFVSAALDRWRAEIRAGGLAAAALERRIAEGALSEEVEREVARELARGVRRAVNATGVVLNTGLGRAPVHREAAAAMEEAARSYCVLEVDRETGERNERDQRLGELLARLSGAEAGIAVNNNAGAVLLAFSTFAQGREAIVSRGELVEIGGSFRVPDVMARASATLVEVGTTNRTRIADYRAAIGERTGLLIKVHTSNFRVVGFVEEVAPAELAELGRERGIAAGWDLGSGLVEDGAAPLAARLGGEPLVRDAVASGFDFVTFSGDKLLGAPQAGLIVGRRGAVAALRRNPIYRALRLDKVALAGLERTLELWLAGRGAEVPARALLELDAARMHARAEAIAGRLARLEGLSVDVVASGSQPGSGSAPGILLETFVVRARHARLSPSALAAALRAAPVPVFARVQDDAVLCDPRTLLDGDEEDLVRAFERAAGAGRDGGERRRTR